MPHQYILYSNPGCRYYPQCLSCPLSDCVYVIGPSKAIKELIALGLPLPEQDKSGKRHNTYYISGGGGYI